MKSVGGAAVVVGLAIVLAGVDVAEAILAKEWALRRSP